MIGLVFWQHFPIIPLYIYICISISDIEYCCTRRARSYAQSAKQFEFRRVWLKQALNSKGLEFSCPQNLMGFPGKLDSGTLCRKALSRWIGRIRDQIYSAECVEFTLPPQLSLLAEYRSWHLDDLVGYCRRCGVAVLVLCKPGWGAAVRSTYYSDLHLWLWLWTWLWTSSSDTANFLYKSAVTPGWDPGGFLNQTCVVEVCAPV